MKMPLCTLFISSILLSACSNDDTKSNEQARLALKLENGDEIVADTLRCIYRQEFGAGNDLSLQLQYLSSPNQVAFALYIDNPIPASPFFSSSGQEGEYTFEVFQQGTMFRNELSNGEIEIALNNLPSPSNLADGDTVTFQGSLSVNPLILPSPNATDVTQLALTESSVDINCESVYQLAELVN